MRAGSRHMAATLQQLPLAAQCPGPATALDPASSDRSRRRSSSGGGRSGQGGTRGLSGQAKARSAVAVATPGCATCTREKGAWLPCRNFTRSSVSMSERLLRPWRWCRGQTCIGVTGRPISGDARYNPGHGSQFARVSVSPCFGRSAGVFPARPASHWAGPAAHKAYQMTCDRDDRAEVGGSSLSHQANPKGSPNRDPHELESRRTGRDWSEGP